MAIKENYLIEKRNALNEVRSNNMNLQELRFFSIYLARINARDVSTRVVRFSLREFLRIMNQGKPNMTHIRNTTDALLSKIIGVNLETGGFRRFQLFKRTEFSHDENGEWYIEIDAHDEALPLMFEFKERYFTYELWNALRLKSSNQLRMYEILKQYETIGERIISIDDLKELLGLNKSDYPRYNNFKACVIDVCQEALQTYTDIRFTCEAIKQKGKGGKVISIKFIISRNDNYADPLSLYDFISIQSAKFGNGDFKSDRLAFLSEACENEFKEAEMQILYNLIVQIIPHMAGGSLEDFNLKAFDYLKHRYDELNWRAEQTEIKNRFGYLRKLLEAAIIIEN